MLGNVFRRITALPLIAKVLLVIAALVLLGLSVLLSPFVVFLALLLLLVAIFALLIRIIRRRPLRTWGLIALASLLLVIVFSRLSSALYGGGGPRQASSPTDPKEEPEPPPTPPPLPPPPSPPPPPPETSVEEVATESASTPSEPEEGDVSEEDEIDQTGGYDATVRVKRVVDGDTLRISPAIDGIDEVRLIGVDTPETKEPGCDVQPYGSEASEFATRELQGEEVDLEFDEEKTDRYDRLLAYVYKEDEMFNEDLLEGGYAQVAIFPPNEKYVDRFEAVQAEAQAVPLGIWALSITEQAQLTDRNNGVGTGDGCQQKAAPPPKALPPPPPAPPPPSAPNVPSVPASGVSGSYPPISQNSCPDSAPIKGNQSGIYHVPGGQYYGRTNPEECFASESDAQAAGYRKSQR